MCIKSLLLWVLHDPGGIGSLTRSIGRLLLSSYSFYLYRISLLNWTVSCLDCFRVAYSDRLSGFGISCLRDRRGAFLAVFRSMDDSDILVHDHFHWWEHELSVTGKVPRYVHRAAYTSGGKLSLCTLCLPTVVLHLGSYYAVRDTFRHLIYRVFYVSQVVRS